MNNNLNVIHHHHHNHGEHECCHGGHHHAHGHCAEHEKRHGKKTSENEDSKCEGKHKHYETIVDKQMHLETEDGQELVCDVLDIFTVDIKGVDKQYIALLAQVYEDVLLYDYRENGDEPILALIEDDEEFDLVSEEFMKRIEQEN